MLNKKGWTQYEWSYCMITTEQLLQWWQMRVDFKSLESLRFVLHLVQAYSTWATRAFHYCSVIRDSILRGHGIYLILNRFYIHFVRHPFKILSMAFVFIDHTTFATTGHILMNLRINRLITRNKLKWRRCRLHWYETRAVLTAITGNAYQNALHIDKQCHDKSEMINDAIGGAPGGTLSRPVLL